MLGSYWANYVIDLESPCRERSSARRLRADRTDLRALLQGVRVSDLAQEAVSRATDLLGIDQPTDVVLMVGVGAANAGELVVNGRGVAFVCLEHFTGRVNPTTYGLGLAPELIPLWIGHELAHTVRYTSPTSESDLKRLVAENGGQLRLLDDGRPRFPSRAPGERRARRPHRATSRTRPRSLRLPGPHQTTISANAGAPSPSFAAPRTTISTVRASGFGSASCPAG